MLFMMESGAIAAVAESAQIPFIAIRAIVDPLDFSPPAALLSTVNPDGSANILPILKLILNRSVHISVLLEMAKGMRDACKTLSRVIQVTKTNIL